MQNHKTLQKESTNPFCTGVFDGHCENIFRSRGNGLASGKIHPRALVRKLSIHPWLQLFWCLTSVPIRVIGPILLSITLENDSVIVRNFAYVQVSYHFSLNRLECSAI